MNDTYPSFSVLMSVYAKENPEFLLQSLISVREQSLSPSQIVLVKDGPLTTDLELIIEKFARSVNGILKVVPLKSNRGLGEALRIGVEECSFDFIARMDTDDICERERFQKQLAFLINNTQYDVVGSYTREFDTDPKNATRSRIVPENHEAIEKRARSQNPMNHMTVFFKKSSVLDAGNYRNALWFEDYDLWVRMLLKNRKFYNLKEPLVKVRVGNDLIGRRHGFLYAKQEFLHFKSMHQMGFLTFSGLIIAISTRLPLRLLPKSFLYYLYKLFLRK